ncbi:hypothetical protein [Streptodolium elevatio]|uniref:Uncharacterized protein n=1 Tax=Streptodolium elevatio TaxID=3157996 RepID=A0ABV3DFZ2_9ACTN
MTVLTACGGGGTSGKAAPEVVVGASDGSGTGSDAYRDCLAANGVELPSGGPQGGHGSDSPRSGFPTARPTDGPSGRPTDRPSGRPSGAPGDRANPRATDPAWQKAEQACAALRPSRAPGEGGPGNGGPGEPGSSDAPNAGGTPGAAAPSAAAEASVSAAQAFTGCMKDHNVEVPAGGATALDRTKPEVAAALTVCEALLPTGG